MNHKIQNGGEKQMKTKSIILSIVITIGSLIAYYTRDKDCAWLVFIALKWI